MNDLNSMGVTALVGALLASGASASVSGTPKIGGVYPLRSGIYVAKGTSCGEPANAAIRQYDGRGISDPHSRACRVRIIARHGSSFVVDQSCIATGVGPAQRSSQRQTLTIQDALTFSVKVAQQTTVYRYCPIYQLPADLRTSLR